MLLSFWMVVDTRILSPLKESGYRVGMQKAFLLVLIIKRLSQIIARNIESFADYSGLWRCKFRGYGL